MRAHLKSFGIIGLLVLFFLSLQGCKKHLSFVVTDFELEKYDGTYIFPENLLYLEPQEGERVVRFDVISENNLQQISEDFDLNGYFVELIPCSALRNNVSQGYSGLSILSKSLDASTAEWTFFVTAQFMQLAVSELPKLGLSLIHI